MKIEDGHPQYLRHRIDFNATPDNPFALFQDWFEEQSRDCHANAMVLSVRRQPAGASSRVVLLKSFSPAGFVFFTNYLSRKGRQIEGDPQVSLLFPWLDRERQVIIEGQASKTSPAMNAEYFDQRPPGSRLAAIRSRQSEVMPDYEREQDEFSQALSQVERADLTVPEHWGGYLVTPARIEFWQGRENRWHDRLLYRHESERWIKQVLYP